jgi:hypothetical protein
VRGFDELKARMDADVDTGVGNTILYRLTEASPALEWPAGSPGIPGFIQLKNQDPALGMISPHQHRWFCKVHKRFLPDGPNIRNRIDHPNLGGVTHRPASDTIDDDGDYYLFDLQAA